MDVVLEVRFLPCPEASASLTVYPSQCAFMEVLSFALF